LILTAALASVAYFIKPSPPPEPTALRTLAGEVRDAETNAPIFGAQISFADQAVSSDASGRFSITYESTSPQPVIIVTHPNYLTKSEPFDLAPDGAQYISTKLVRASTDALPPATPVQASSPASSPPATPTETATPALSSAVVPPTSNRTLFEWYARYYLWLLTVFAALPFIAYLLWRVWRMIRRRQLERWRTEKKPDLARLVVKGVDAYLYKGTAFRRFAQELRRHRRLKSNVLDSASTAEATSRTGGLFSPVYGTRQLTPDYLVLVDRKNFRDQQAHLDDEIVNRLKREGVFVDSFYFEGDPRICWKRGTRTDEPYRTLQDLTSRYPDHRLILFSDGAGLLDPLSGRPHGWVEQFESWEVRTLLTPAPEWGYREWALEQTGFAVLPAWTEGMAALVEAIRTSRKPKAKRTAETSDYPQLLLRRPERWLKERAPAPEIIEELRLQLRYYLGSEGYYLLSACAVYPQLLWGLTFYLAYHLVGEGQREETLEALLRLPWLRHGTMPDWLRSDMISHLPPERDARIRTVLGMLLANYVRHPHEGFWLEVAPEPAKAGGAWGRFFRRVGRKLGEWRRLKFLHDLLRTEPEESSLRDYVFVNFMSGSKLAVSLPAKVRLFLYRRGQPILGLHPVRGLVLPALLALVSTTTLLSFEPDLKTSEPECGLPCKIPGLSELMARLPTPTPVIEPSGLPLPSPDPATDAVVGTCRNDLTAASGYLIRAVGYRDGSEVVSNGSTRLLNMTYSPDRLVLAESLTRNMFASAQTGAAEARKELLDLSLCVKVMPPDLCRSSRISTGKCVDLEYTLRTRLPGALEIVSPPGNVSGPDLPLTVRNINPSTETLRVKVKNADSKLDSLNVVSVPRGVSQMSIPVKLAPGVNEVTFVDPRHLDDPRFRTSVPITYDDGDLTRFTEGKLTVRLDGPAKAVVEISNPSLGSVTLGGGIIRNYVGSPLQITVPKGPYNVSTSAEGYLSSSVRIVVRSRAENPAGENLVMALQRVSTPTPTPMPTPPPPLLTIDSVEVALQTADDDKDKNSSITVRVFLGGEQWAQYGPLGRGEGWDKKSTKVLNVPLKSPIPLDMCKQVSIQVTQESDNDERWNVIMGVHGTLSNKSRVPLLPWTEVIRLRSGSGSGDKPEFTGKFACP
jgi:hypothetical protein